MNRSTSTLTAALAASSALFVATAAHGAVIAEYNFNDGTATATNVAGNVVADNFAAGPGIGLFSTNAGAVAGVGGSLAATFNAASLPGSNDDPGSSTRTIGENKFFEITLTPAAGFKLDLSDITFYGWGNPALSDDVEYTWFVRSSETGEVDLGTATSNLRVATASPPTTDSQFTIDLSGVTELQDVDGEVTLILGGFKTALVNNAGNFRIDDVVVNGNVALIPEPVSVSSLLGLGAMGMLRRRR